MHPHVLYLYHCDELIVAGEYPVKHPVACLPHENPLADCAHEKLSILRRSQSRNASRKRELVCLLLMTVNLQKQSHDFCKAVSPPLWG